MATHRRAHMSGKTYRGITIVEKTEAEDSPQRSSATYGLGKRPRTRAGEALEAESDRYIQSAPGAGPKIRWGAADGDEHENRSGADLRSVSTGSAAF